MTYLNIIRKPPFDSDKGVSGELFAGGPGWQLRCVTLELPWRANQPNISCVPPGNYPARRGRAHYKLRVKGRHYITLKSGQFAGDTQAGFKTSTKGCILVGTCRTMHRGQPRLSGGNKIMKALKGLVDDDVMVCIQEAPTYTKAVKPCVCPDAPGDLALPPARYRVAR